MKICALTDIPSPGGKPGSIRVNPPGWDNEHGLCLIRQGLKVYAYLNQCPHMNMPMDWVEGQFLTADQQYIQCAVHGALFNPDDGRCVAGPCQGQPLTAVPIIIQDGDVLLGN